MDFLVLERMASKPAFFYRTLDPAAYVLAMVDRFAQDVRSRLGKFC